MSFCWDASYTWLHVFRFTDRDIIIKSDRLDIINWKGLVMLGSELFTVAYPGFFQVRCFYSLLQDVMPCQPWHIFFSIPHQIGLIYHTHGRGTNAHDWPLWQASGKKYIYMYIKTEPKGGVWTPPPHTHTHTHPCTCAWLFMYK